MPARQVYGKRTGGKSTANFAKFISPDKDEGEYAKKDGRDARLAAGREATKAIRELEKELAVLDLSEREGPASKVEKRRRPRRVVEDDEDSETGLGKTHRGIGPKNDKTKSKSACKNVCSVIDLTNEEVDPGHGKSCNVIDLTEDMAEPALAKDENKVQHQRSQKATRKATSRRPDQKRTSTSTVTTGSEQTNTSKSFPNSISTSEPERAGKRVPLRELGWKVADAGANEESKQSLPAPVRARKLKSVMIPRRSASPKMPALPTPDLTPEPDDPYTEYVSALLSLSYTGEIVPFDAWSAALEPYFQVSKIAEASYSEVYRLTATSAACGPAKESVLKLVALKTSPSVLCSTVPQKRRVKDPERRAREALKAREEKEQWKSHVEDVHSEVQLLQNLNHIPGFTNFRELTVLRGKPSAPFVAAWKAWNKARPRDKKSEFPDPSKRTSYDETQLWAVIEMQDAGTDCEKVMAAGGIGSVWEVWDVFWGVCLSVAKAEETCRFEHRDLHLENICIRSSRSQSEQDLTAPIVRDPLRRKLGFTGLDTTVIDYTLSRAEILPSSPPSPSLAATAPEPLSSSAEIAFLDLDKDPALFEADASQEYQYEIYRYMRDIVLRNNHNSNNSPISPQSTPRRSPRKTPHHIRFDDNPDPAIAPPPQPIRPAAPPSSHSSPWRAFHPQTNLLWAHFLLHQLLAHIDGAEPPALTSEQLMHNVRASSEEAPRVVKKANRMYKVLLKVGELLEPGRLMSEGALGSVGELVVLALERGWVGVGDVVG